MEITGKSQEMSYTSTQESPRSMGGIQPTLMNPSPSTARQPLILEKEPMDTDSGTATGSDFGSSSPESDRSETPNLFDPEPIVKITEQMKSDENLSKLQKVPGNDDFLSGGFSPEASGSATEKIKSENDNTNCNDQDSTASKINSHGRVRKFKCKQCDFFSTDKLEYWEHIKTHMNPSKVLSCPNCPFVTEYKHHLEYHLRNHTGTKPFKCSKCAYSCVNNSMLKSHMKSHSNIYQYRCANCPFASKYCHSLKLHLRKSSHSPAMVLDPDGTPNPLPIIDVYGTRRGPEINDPGQRPASPNPDVLPVAPFPSNQLLLNAASSTGYLPFPRLLNGIPNPYIMEMDRLRRDRHAIVPNGSPPDIKKNETCYLDPSIRGAPESNDSSEEDGEENDRRFYTTIFDNVEVVDNSLMVEGDGTENELETHKLGLLKNKQSPAMFLDSDSTPNPSPIVDVNGTRRGPKIKNPGYKPASPNPNILPVTPFSLNQVLATAANMSIRFPGFSFYSGFLNGSSSPLMMEIERLTRKMQAVSSLPYGPSLNSEENESCVLDLSKREAPNKDDSFEGKRSHPEIEETVQ